MAQKHNKAVIRILFFTILLNLTGFAIILPLSPALMGFYLDINGNPANPSLIGQFVKTSNAIAQSLGHSDSAFMTSVFFGCLLGSLYAFLQFIFAPIWGRISDRLGRRRVLLYTLFGTALSYMLWIIAGTFELFILSRIFAGIMAGNLSVATAAMADVTSKKKRTQGMAIVGVAFGIGFLIGPAVGGLLTTIDLTELFPSLTSLGINPFSTPAIVASLFAWANFFWVYIRLEETLAKEKRMPLKTEQPLFANLKKQTPAIKQTNLIYFIFILGFSGLEFTLSFLATERFGYKPVQVGYLFLFIGFVLILTQGYIVRYLSPVAGEKNLAIGGIISGMLSFSVIAFAMTQVLFFLGSLFLALAIGLASPSLSALVSLYSTESNQGHSMGLFRSSGALARAFGPMLAAIPYFYFGSQTAYLSAAVILLGPLTLIFFLPNPDKS